MLFMQIIISINTFQKEIEIDKKDVILFLIIHFGLIINSSIPPNETTEINQIKRIKMDIYTIQMDKISTVKWIMKYIIII